MRLFAVQDYSGESAHVRTYDDLDIMREIFSVWKNNCLRVSAYMFDEDRVLAYRELVCVCLYISVC